MFNLKNYKYEKDIVGFIVYDKCDSIECTDK